MMLSLRDSDWFAGFTDGEASFQFLTDNRQPAATRHAPIFGITLRLDDLAILEALRDEFGGSISTRPASPPSGTRGPSKPIAQWKVASKADLVGLVRYFDAHPLRAKKARDYTIWRRAVRAYLRGGRRDPELPALLEALTAGRAYDAEPLEEVPESPQLHLVEDGDLRNTRFGI